MEENDQREEFLDNASGGFPLTRTIIEGRLVQVESGEHRNIHQSAGWHSIGMNGNTINAVARIRGRLPGQSVLEEYSWEVSA